MSHVTRHTSLVTCSSLTTLPEPIKLGCTHTAWPTAPDFLARKSDSSVFELKLIAICIDTASCSFWREVDAFSDVTCGFNCSFEDGERCGDDNVNTDSDTAAAAEVAAAAAASDFDGDMGDCEEEVRGR